MTAPDTDALRPGSPEAVKQGCTCPVLDNFHGCGYRINGNEPIWWTHADCPLHGFNGHDWHYRISPEQKKREDEKMNDQLDAARAAISRGNPQ